MLFACFQAPERRAFLETEALQPVAGASETFESRLASLHDDVIDHANHIMTNVPVVDQQIRAKIKLLDSLARRPDAPPIAKTLSQRANEHYFFTHAYRRKQQMLEKQLRPALAFGRFPRGGIARLRETLQPLIQSRACDLKKAALIGALKARIKAESRKISVESIGYLTSPESTIAKSLKSQYFEKMAQKRTLATIGKAIKLAREHRKTINPEFIRLLGKHIDV